MHHNYALANQEAIERSTNTRFAARSPLEESGTHRARMRQPKIRAVLREQFNKLRVISEYISRSGLDLGQDARMEVLDFVCQALMLARTLTMCKTEMVLHLSHASSGDGTLGRGCARRLGKRDTARAGGASGWRTVARGEYDGGQVRLNCRGAPGFVLPAQVPILPQPGRAAITAGHQTPSVSRRCPYTSAIRGSELAACPAMIEETS